MSLLICHRLRGFFHLLIHEFQGFLGLGIFSLGSRRVGNTLGCIGDGFLGGINLIGSHVTGTLDNFTGRIHRLVHHARLGTAGAESLTRSAAIVSKVSATALNRIL